jgi:hypothetical protein
MSRGFVVMHALLGAAAGLRLPHSAAADSRSTRRSACVTAAAAVLTATTATAADDSTPAVDAIRGAVESLGKPGFEIVYDGPYMDRDTGTLRYPISGVEPADPVSAVALLFGAGATRLGGILPDEMPFNVVQKFLRGVLPYGWFPDLADDDFRKQYQDVWYGTNEVAALPEFMRSRPLSPPTSATSEATADAVADAADDAGTRAAGATADADER